MTESDHVLAIFAQLGFAPWHTGGGCTALRKPVTDRGETLAHILVTEDSGCAIPTDRGGRYSVGIYDSDDGSETDFRCDMTLESAVEFIAELEADNAG